ncbi:MAG: MaoC family dehydratase [Deltaproteobacteria bacterium]|nr:MaoC family dehydratase [Deltaproteobacteria bacterium]
MSAEVVKDLNELLALKGRSLGNSEWIEVDQARVTAFADATLDHQWIHIDAERAAKETQFGGTIAHGYLTLSLVPYLYHQVIDVQGAKMTINYGLNKVRFPSPVPTGSKVRLGLTVGDVEEIKGGFQVIYQGAMEIEGGEKPAMVAELVFRYYA